MLVVVVIAIVVRIGGRVSARRFVGGPATGDADRDDHRRSDRRRCSPAVHERRCYEPTDTYGAQCTSYPRHVMSDAAFEFDYPGAEHPAREYKLHPNGVGIAVHEWGDEDAPPLLLVHGGMDFARTFDVFAPKLAAGGWRVVSWDHRGHGDSDHVELYSWDADMRDALADLRPRVARPAAAGDRTLEGRCADDPTRRRTVVPVHPPREPRRHSVHPAYPRHRRARAFEDDGRRDRRMAEPSTDDLDRDAQAGHPRRTRQATRA